MFFKGSFFVQANEKVILPENKPVVTKEQKSNKVANYLIPPKKPILKLEELKIAADEINKLADPGVNMIFGMGTDEKMNSEIRVTIIATGFETNESYIDMNDTSEDIFQIIDEEQKYAPVDLPPFLRKYVQNM